MIRNIAKDDLVRLFKLTIIKTLLSFAEIKKEYELQKFSRQGKSGCLSVIIFLVPLNELRSEEHTSELQSRFDLVCRLLLEKKKKYNKRRYKRNHGGAKTSGSRPWPGVCAHTWRRTGHTAGNYAISYPYGPTRSERQ